MYTFHPNFFKGQPGSLEMTVRNSLQPAFITSVVNSACATAEAAESSKETYHEANVIAAGGLFYPRFILPSFSGNTWSKDTF